MNRDDLEKFVRDLREFQKELERKQLSMFKKLVDHLEYHNENEAKWGLVKIMRDNPFKVMLAGLMVGALLAFTFGKEIKELFIHLVGLM